MYLAAFLGVFLLSVGAAENEEKIACKLFDAAFPYDSSQLPHITTNDSLTLPEGIVTFTLCYWLKPSVGSDLSVFSHNTLPLSRSGNVLGWSLERHGKAWKSELCFHLHCAIMAVPEVNLNEWHHFCVMYDGANASAKLIYNGKEHFEAYDKTSYRNFGIPVNGVVLFGQDQDSYGEEEIQAEQNVRGKVSRLQMWDRLLDLSEVKLQHTCNAPEGNLISWTKTHWVFLNGAMNVSSELCPTTVGGVSMAIWSNTEAIADLQNSIREYKKEAYMKMTNLKENILSLNTQYDELLQEVDILKERKDVAPKVEVKPCQKEINELKQRLDEAERQQERLTWQFSGELGSLREEIRQVAKSTEIQLSSCPAKFTRVDRHCYYFSPYVLNNWNDALVACQAMDSNLLILESKEEWFSIQHYLGLEKMHKENWWTGGTDAAMEGEWVWTGSDEKIQFLPWCKGEPNGGSTQNCLHMREVKDGWCYNDLPCANPGKVFSMKFICEAELVEHCRS